MFFLLISEMNNIITSSPMSNKFKKKILGHLSCLPGENKDTIGVLAGSYRANHSSETANELEAPWQPQVAGFSFFVDRGLGIRGGGLQKLLRVLPWKNTHSSFWHNSPSCAH